MICDEYAEKDKRVCVIHQPNGGLSAARNAGIGWAFTNSNSQWISFADSDDWVHPRYLELLYQTACGTGTKLSACEFERVEQTIPFEQVSGEPELWAWDELLEENNVAAVIAWSKLYAKELFIGLRYPVGKVHEDEFLTYKLLHRAGSVGYLPASLYFYFQNPDGIMRKAFSLSRFDGSEAIRERIRYVHALKNRQFLGFCVRQYLWLECSNIRELRETKVIPLEQKKQVAGKHIAELRRVLLRYGLRYAPPWEHGQYYTFAFPGASRLAIPVLRCVRAIRNSRRNKIE